TLSEGLTIWFGLGGWKNHEMSRLTIQPDLAKNTKYLWGEIFT
ncbi:Uncharacterized protein APZ42_000192, partial [Daphnia magna]